LGGAIAAQMGLLKCELFHILKLREKKVRKKKKYQEKEIK